MSTAYSYYTIPGLDSRIKGVSIIEAVNIAFNVTLKGAMLKKRKAEYVDARRVAIFLLITIDNQTLTSASAMFKKDHSTASYSISKCQAFFQTDSKFRKKMFQVFDLLNLQDATREHLISFLKSDVTWREFTKKIVR